MTLYDLNHGIDQEVDAFLGPDATKHPDTEFSREVECLPRFSFAFSVWRVALAVDPVRYYNIRFTRKISRRRIGGGDQTVRF